MANFSPFKITSAGLDLEYLAQTGQSLKFTKFKVGDGKINTRPIETLTDLVNPIMDETIARLNIQKKDNIKNVQIGFNIDNRNIEHGFYLREIGLFAEHPTTKQEILVFYSNAGDSADYIPSNTETTLAEKLIDIELYISNVENITAVIDSSVVFVTKDYVDTQIEELTTIIGEFDELKADKKKVWNIVIDTENWTSIAPYTKTIQLDGLLATDIINMYPVYSDNIDTRATEREEYSKISIIEGDDDEILLTCDEEKPNVNLNVRLEVYY